MSKKRIKELEKLITQARNDYYNNQPTVSDRVFDAWVDELRLLDSNNQAVTSIGAPIIPSEWKKAKHQIPMGSLDKVNTPEEFTKWANEALPDGKFLITEKLDGISIEVIYENGKFVQAITRGDGETGEDISVNVIKMGGVKPELVDNFTGSLRGEIIMKKSVHKEHFSDKANPRNAASGVAKRLDGVGVDKLNILFYQALGDVDFGNEQLQFTWLVYNGLGTPNWWVVKTSDKVNEFWREYQDKDRDKLDYDIDGLVVRVDNMEKQLALGDKDLRPKGAIAFKFDNEAKTTVVKDIVWQVGNSGRLTPVAILEPVNLVGATVSKASIYNMAYIKELGIGTGAEVLVVRANDVIPRVEEVITPPTKIESAPKYCPLCNAAVRFDGENLVCTNHDKCSAQIEGRVKNWVAELNILELGDTLIEKLVASGLVKTPADLYKLSVDDLAGLDRMGEKSAQNVYDSLWKNNPVPLELFLGALSIPMIGSSTIKLLIESGYDSLDKILLLKVAEVEAVKGIGPVKAESLVKGLSRNKDVIQGLLDNGVKIKEKIIGNLTNKSLCFTGSMKNKRALLEQMVIDAGGTVKSSVGKGLSYLVIDDVNSTSSKAVAARKLGTTLLSENEFLEMIK